jgi:hypothetical protein
LWGSALVSFLCDPGLLDDSVHDIAFGANDILGHALQVENNFSFR